MDIKDREGKEEETHHAPLSYKVISVPHGFCHPLYLALGKDNRERSARYQALFDQFIPDYTLEEIRTATNKAWVLGNGKFKQQIELKLGYALPPLLRGGDRKSGKYIDTNNKGKIKVL